MQRYKSIFKENSSILNLKNNDVYKINNINFVISKPTPKEFIFTSSDKTIIIKLVFLNDGDKLYRREGDFRCEYINPEFKSWRVFYSSVHLEELNQAWLEYAVRFVVKENIKFNKVQNKLLSHYSKSKLEDLPVALSLISNNKTIKTNYTLKEITYMFKEGDISLLLPLMKKEKQGFFVVISLSPLSSFAKANRLQIILQVDLDNVLDRNPIEAKIDIVTLKWENYGYGGSYYNDQNSNETVELDKIEQDLKSMIVSLKYFLATNRY